MSLSDERHYNSSVTAVDDNDEPEDILSDDVSTSSTMQSTIPLPALHLTSYQAHQMQQLVSPSASFTAHTQINQLGIIHGPHTSFTAYTQLNQLGFLDSAECSFHSIPTWTPPGRLAMNYQGRVPGSRWPSSTSIDGDVEKAKTSYGHTLIPANMNSYMYRYYRGLAMPSYLQSAVDNGVPPRSASRSAYSGGKHCVGDNVDLQLLQPTTSDRVQRERPSVDVNDELETIRHYDVVIRETGAAPRSDRKRKRKQRCPSQQQQQHNDYECKRIIRCDKSPSRDRVPAESWCDKYPPSSPSEMTAIRECTSIIESPSSELISDDTVNLFIKTVPSPLHRQAVVKQVQAANADTIPRSPTHFHQIESSSIGRHAVPVVMTTTDSAVNLDCDNEVLDLILEDEELQQLACNIKEEIIGRLDLIVDRAISVCTSWTHHLRNTNLRLSTTNTTLQSDLLPVSRAQTASDWRTIEPIISSVYQVMRSDNSSSDETGSVNHHQSQPHQQQRHIDSRNKVSICCDSTIGLLGTYML